MPTGVMTFGCREFAVFYISKSHLDLQRAKRLFETLIIIPAVCLALHQQPAARSIALLSLGRKRGGVLARAMEGDRDIRRQKALRSCSGVKNLGLSLP